MEHKPKEIGDYFESLCDDCLMLAVNEYLHRVGHKELRALKARIYMQPVERQEGCDES